MSAPCRLAPVAGLLCGIYRLVMWWRHVVEEFIEKLKRARRFFTRRQHRQAKGTKHKLAHRHASSFSSLA